MDKTNGKAKNTLGILVSVLIAAVLLVLSVMFALTSFRKTISNVAEEQAYARLRENMRQQVSYFDRTKQEFWGGLEFLSLLIRGNGDSPAVLDEHIAQLKEANDFLAISYQDADGKRLAGDDFPADNVDLEEFLAEARQKKSLTLIKIPEYSVNPVFVFSFPVVEEGNQLGALFSVYPSAEIFKDMFSEAFNQQCYTGIMTRSGKILMFEDHRRFYDTTKNGIDVLKAAELKNTTVDSLIRRFDRKYGGNAAGLWDGSQYYASFTSMNENDWVVFNIIASRDTGELSDEIMNAASQSVFVLLIIAVLIFVFFLLRETRAARQHKYESDLMQQIQQSYQLVTRLSDGVMFEGDYHFDTFTLNDNFSRIFGFSPKIRHISDFLHPDVHVITEDTWKFIAMGKEFMKGSDQAYAEFRVRSDSGDEIWMRVDYMTIYDNQHRPKRLIGKMSNVDSQVRQLTQLETQAERDPLTKLFNRETMKTKTRTFLSQEGLGKHHAFFILDIDNFKQVNDSCGHAAGDVVLVKLADTMRRHFRESDILARLGGDEFVLLMKDVGNDAMLYAKASELLEGIHGLTEECNFGTEISCSIGISLFDRDGKTFDELYKKADAALYSVKSSGKNQFKISS